MWAEYKRRFRKELTELKLLRQPFHTEIILRSIDDSMTTRQIKSSANYGWINIFKKTKIRKFQKCELFK